MKDKANLYGWLFTFNHYTGLWNAAKREHLNEMFSNKESKKVISSKSIDTLISLIIKAEGEDIHGYVNTQYHGYERG